MSGLVPGFGEERQRLGGRLEALGPWGLSLTPVSEEWQPRVEVPTEGIVAKPVLTGSHPHVVGHAPRSAVGTES